MDPELLAQFPIAEEAIEALGFVLWPEVEFEADDAIGAAAARFAADPAVEQIVICTPDKDMAQCVVDERIVLRDRRQAITYDEAAVLAKWGVRPASIPDWLALVGDSSDGYPGLPGWGAKAAAAVLRRYESIDDL
jgi:5'-3' exonuclease